MKASKIIRTGIWICLSPIVVPAMLALLLWILFVETVALFFAFMFDDLGGDPFEMTKSAFEDVAYGITKLFKK